MIVKVLPLPSPGKFNTFSIFSTFNLFAIFDRFTT